MTIFELVKIALDELYEEGQKQYGNSLDKKIKERMGYLTESYGQLTDPNREPVNYKDPATRFAYVYKYVAAHGDYLVQVMQRLKARQGNIFEAERVRVSCVGGGPGSDIIGVLKYLDDHQNDEPVRRVTCYLLDKEQAWADTWTELGESLEAHVAVNANFQALDVSCKQSWSTQKKFLDADIFTMSYFVSEVFRLKGVGEFWKMLFEDAKQGALFLYNDNAHSDFNEYFDEQWKSAGLECLMEEGNTRFTPRFSEQSADLEDYLGKFGQQPKLQGLVSYRVLRKG
jgi:Putative SAM-dependent methyltransferase